MYMYHRGGAGIGTRWFKGVLSLLLVLVLVIPLVHPTLAHADANTGHTGSYDNGTYTVSAWVTGTTSDFPADGGHLCDSGNTVADGYDASGDLMGSHKDANGNKVKQHADFEASITSPWIEFGTRGATLHYNLNLDWKACDDGVASYAIYSDDFCNYITGDYASSGGSAHDCIKYVPSANDAGYQASLGCKPSNDPNCITPWFVQYAQQIGAVPTTKTSKSIPEFATIPNSNPNTGSTQSGSAQYAGRYVTKQICEYYTYGGNMYNKTTHPHSDRCVTLSISYQWSAVLNPTSQCTDSLYQTSTNMWPGEQGYVKYDVTTRNVPGSPSGKIINSAGNRTNGTLQPSGSTLSGIFSFTAPTIPGTYSGYVGGGAFQSTQPAGQHPYNSTCSPGSITITVGYMPYFKAYGGDVQVGYYPSSSQTACVDNTDTGGGITAWNTGSAGTYAGAGSQFGADALGVITGFTSGQPDGGHSGAEFTRANGPSLVDPGGNTYGGKSGDNSTRSCVNYAAGMTDANTLKPDSNGTLRNLEPGYVGAGVVPISDIKDRYVLYVKGNLYLDRNIQYDSSYTLSAIPSFKIVVVGNIYIAPTVTQLDGVYIAQPDSSGNGGNIYTCATNSSGSPVVLQVNNNSYTSGTCSDQLTVNGTFAAKNVYLLRTHGSLSSSIASTDKYGGGTTLPTSNAAEQFIYSPETWLGQATGGNPTPAAIVSLPPVY